MTDLPVPTSPTTDHAIIKSRELAVAIADVISETPASDTRVIDIHDLTTIADFFVICSGENERQLRAISRALIEDLGENDLRPRKIEGEPVSGWILMDYADVIVHIFDEELRAFYDLEERWSEAPVLLAIQ
ncbi:MAG: ribosome silencing factor [Chloroflexota bacterium]|nr:ribosome silencing factor [Chloroflexota bacterium]